MHRIPFIRITIPAAIGIVFHEFWPIHVYLPIALVCISFAIIGLSTLPFWGMKSLVVAHNQWVGLSIIVCFFSVAYLYAYIRSSPKPYWDENKEMVMRIRLLDSPQKRERSYRVEAEMLDYLVDDVFMVSNGKMLLYFSKETDCESWKPNDELILAAKLNSIDPPKNPGEFDLAAYNKRKGIYYRAFIQPNQVLSYSPDDGFSINGLTYRAEQYLLALSAKHFNSPSEKALSDALVLGYQDDLDEETVTRFSKSGTSHVLAVSGLHIGILWLVVDKLLFFLNPYKTTRWIKFFLSLGILWAYALLTGLSPSVMRAAVMFSCFAAGGILKQRHSSLNILFVSSFIQMLINPMVLFNAGFQLSYSAVAGILIFYPPIKDAIYFHNKSVRLLWEVVALTLAAQMITTPISLYWFGQFPVWFIFSNLPLVPLSSLALIFGLAAYALDWLPFVGELLFHLFILSIKLMDALAAFFGDLPYGLLYLRIDLWDAFLLYVLMATISLFLVKRNPIWFKASLAVVCIYLSNMLMNELNFSSSNKWVMYHLKQGTVLRYYSGHEVEEFRSDKVDRKSYSFSVKPSDKVFQVRNKIEIIPEDNFFSIGNKKVVLLRDKHLQPEIEHPVSCDWVVMESMKYIDFNRLQQNFVFNKLIIGSGNSYSSRKFWKKECIKRNIPFYDVAESGAWITID
jgi:competence protein ComEC